MDDFNDFGNNDADKKNSKAPERQINHNTEPKANAPEGEPIFTDLADDDFVDLSKFYNTEDIGILSDDSIQNEEPASKQERSKKENKQKKSNPWIKRGIAIFFAAVVLGGVLFSVFRDKNTYYKLYKQGDKISNGNIELTVEHANIVDSLLTYQLDENYVYVAVVYTFKNISKQALGWECTPYMSLQPYTLTDKGYLPLSAEEKASLLETLKNLKSNSENADAPNADKVDDAQQVPDSLTVDENGNPTETNDTDSSSTGNDANSGVLIGDAYNKEVKSATEASGDETVAGVFDFNALQIFALDAGLDFSTVKDDLKPGESRQSADVFKIRKELFDNKKYFIGADNLPGIIEISLTPLDIDSKQTQEQDSQQQQQTTEEGENE